MRQDDEKEKITIFQEKRKNPGGLLGVSDITKIFNVTPQGVYYHIGTGRLTVYKSGKKILIDPVEYGKMTKWDRSCTVKNDELVYDKNKGTFSLVYLSKLLNVKYNELYYLIKKGQLKFKKIEGCIVIDENDLMRCDSIKCFVKDLLGDVANECASECIDCDSEGLRQNNEEKVSSI